MNVSKPYNPKFSQHAAQAVARLEEAQANAASGRHQFLSGLLHNLAKILAADHVPADACAALEAAGLGPGAPHGSRSSGANLSSMLLTACGCKLPEHCPCATPRLPTWPLPAL